jgi:SAM-dependent methyltransferase
MPAANLDSVPSFFWDRYRDTTVGRYLTQRELAFIRHSLGTATQPRRLLDIACGSGRITSRLHDAGLNVVGVDYDTVALDAFRQRSKAVPLVMGDGQRLPFAAGSFDCVVAVQCFIYFDPCRFLHECNRVLCDGGLLIFQSLNRRNYKRALKRLLGRDERYGLSDNLSFHEVLQTIADHSFEIHRISGYNWVPFDRYSNTALVGVAAQLEQILRLDRLYSLSPWTLIAARKRSW